nr:unnamed protein product [Timema californicum]
MNGCVVLVTVCVVLVTVCVVLVTVCVVLVTGCVVLVTVCVVLVTVCVVLVTGCKTIIVKIRDVASAVSVSVYINSWYQRAYPIGLIHGAHVVLTNLQQKMSAKNSVVYFLTSGTSSVVVKDMNQPPHFESKEDWGPPCNLLLAVPGKRLLWGTVEMDRLLKVSVQFRCEYCSHPFIRGRCSYAGCWGHPKGEMAAVCT